MQSRTQPQGHAASQGQRNQGGGSYRDALEQNRRQAGLKPRGDVFADKNHEPTDTVSGGGRLRLGSLFLRLSGATLKTKLIILLSIVGAILYITAWMGSTLDQVVAAVTGEDAKPSGRQATPQKTVAPPPGEICDESEPLKTMGTQWLGATEYAPGITMSVKNRSQQIAFLDIQNPSNGQRATTLVVMPGDEIRFPLAGTGAAGSVSSGSRWCNRKIGWQDAQVVPIRPAILATKDTQEIKSILYDRGNALGLKVFNQRVGRPAPAEFS